jgi:putative ABC transport system permease protein
VNAVGSHYFDVVGMTLRSGRAFTATDGVEAERVAIVSETLARQIWPDRTAIGQRIRTGADMNSGDEPAVWRTIVGVVSDTRETHRDTDYKDVFLPALQTGTRFASVLGKPGARLREWHESVRAIAIELNPHVDIGVPDPLADGARKELARPRFLMSVLTGIAALAVAIALIGIYGVTAYAVEQRRREIAVRSALGASPLALVGLFVAEGGRVVGLGVVAGMLGAVWLGRVLQNQVYGVAPSDSATLATAAAIVAAGCLAAAWLPARRAASLDASAVLRAD